MIDFCTCCRRKRLRFCGIIALDGKGVNPLINVGTTTNGVTHGLALSLDCRYLLFSSFLWKSYFQIRFKYREIILMYAVAVLSLLLVYYLKVEYIVNSFFLMMQIAICRSQKWKLTQHESLVVMIAIVVLILCNTSIVLYRPQSNSTIDNAVVLIFVRASFFIMICGSKIYGTMKMSWFSRKFGFEGIE